jgi:hypothetical protein
MKRKAGGMAQHPGKIKLNIWACLMKRGALRGLDTSFSQYEKR